MNEQYIKKLIRLVEESDIESLEVSSWGRKVRITQRGEMTNGAATGNGHAAPAIAVAPNSAPAHPEAAPVPAAPAPATSENVHEVKSPMVGTYYSAPSPDADPYVSLNEKVRAGQVICIVEAMKLMNEIESDISGRVVEICVENSQPVEFGQVLFKIVPE